MSEMDDELESAYKILIVGPSWVGDMVMSQTLYKILRQRHPDALIDEIAPPASVSLVTRMAEVSRGIKFQMPHGEVSLAKRKAFGHALRKNNYDQAIILPNSLKSALVPFHADIPIRTAFRGEYRYYLINDMRLLHKRNMPRMIDRFAALGVKLGQVPQDIPFPELMIDEVNQARLLTELSLNQDRPILGICPGAEFGDAKKWPEQHYGKVAQAAIDQGKQVWIFGGPGDQATGELICAQVASKDAKHCLNLAGETGLLDVIDLLNLCQQVVSNDSGLMHIAAAVGCATTVVYGSTSPGFTPPLTEKLDIVSLDLDCRPCFKRTCPLKHKDCLNKLLPERIIERLENL